MRSFPYHIVDVFTQTALEGNALAVVLDAEALDTPTMQRIAREMNLSETSFVCSPASSTSAPRVRIFTPAYEMFFAGHPTIGTAWVLRMFGLIDRERDTFALHENVGDVAIRVDKGDDPLLWLTSPPPHFGETVDVESVARAVSLEPSAILAPPQMVSVGNPLIFVAVRDTETVDRARIVGDAFDRIARRDQPTAVYLFAMRESGPYGRMFSPELGITEDPATGSAMGPLAAYMQEHAMIARGAAQFVCEQGTFMGRRSLLHVLVRDDETVEVGGNVVHVAAGTLGLS